MSWKVRHQGSPRAVEGLTLAQIVEGLQERHWETTDEVMAPGETRWTAIENHPKLAEIAADIDVPPPKPHDDETHLDMNAMIDVCLVLLIFFILTTSYAALQSRLTAAETSTDKQIGPPTVTKEQVDQTMIKVSAKMEAGKPVIRIEENVVEPGSIEVKLRRIVGQTAKAILILEIDPKVPHGTTVSILDAAKGASIKKIMRVIP